MKIQIFTKIIMVLSIFFVSLTVNATRYTIVDDITGTYSNERIWNDIGTANLTLANGDTLDFSYLETVPSLSYAKVISVGNQRTIIGNPEKKYPAVFSLAASGHLTLNNFKMASTGYYTGITCSNIGTATLTIEGDCEVFATNYGISSSSTNLIINGTGTLLVHGAVGGISFGSGIRNFTVNANVTAARTSGRTGLVPGGIIFSGNNPITIDGTGSLTAKSQITTSGTNDHGIFFSGTELASVTFSGLSNLNLIGSGTGCGIGFVNSSDVNRQISFINLGTAVMTGGSVAGTDSIGAGISLKGTVSDTDTITVTGCTVTFQSPNGSGISTGKNLYLTGMGSINAIGSTGFYAGTDCNLTLNEVNVTATGDAGITMNGTGKVNFSDTSTKLTVNNNNVQSDIPCSQGENSYYWLVTGDGNITTGAVGDADVTVTIPAAETPTTTTINLYEPVPVCEIGSTPYMTLDDAITAVTSGETITLLDNITAGDITFGKGFTLGFDLNGYNFTVGDITLSSGILSILKVTNSGTEGSFTANNFTASYVNPGNAGIWIVGADVTINGNINTTGRVFVQNGTLTVGGNITANSPGGGNAIDCSNGTVTVGGNVNANGNSGATGVVCSNGAQVTIDGVLSVPSGTYINVGQAKTPSDKEAVSTKPGYDEYKNGTNIVWVKMPPVYYVVNFSLSEESENYGTLTATVDGVEIVSGDEVEEGKEVVFAVMPNLAIQECQFTVNGNMYLSWDSTYTVTILSETTVEVEIVPARWGIMYNVFGDEGGTLTVTVDEEILEGNLILEGKDVLFTATPAPGYRVNYWTDNFSTVNGKNLTYTVENINNMHNITVAFELIPETVPVITTSAGALPDGTIDTPYSVTLEADNDPTGWTLTSGALPAGLDIDDDGVISGTPEEDGTFNFTVVAFNSDGYSASVAFSITIGQTTGIDDIPQAKTLQAYIQNGTLYVSGLTAGKIWNVYNATGALVHQSIATGSKADITLEVYGVYIVQSGNDVVKVMY